MNDFSIQGYRSLLVGLHDAGYQSRTLLDLAPTRRDVFLRHDVDFCPRYCLSLAQMEYELGFRSVFYLLVSSPFYNVHEQSTRRVIRSLLAMGHEIGLHFDASTFGGDSSNAESAARHELSVLESVSGDTVASISFHRPVPALVGCEADFAGRPHAYQPRFCRDICYVSDSTGRWRFGHPFASDGFARKVAMQILTHPIWWYSEQAESPEVRLRRFVEEHNAEFFDSVRRNTKVLDSHLKEQ